MGDAVLNLIAERLQASLRLADSLGSSGGREQIAARLRGDEFVVVLGHMMRPDDTYAAALRLIDVLSHPYGVVTHQLHCSVSMWIVLGAQTRAMPTQCCAIPALPNFPGPSWCNPVLWALCEMRCRHGIQIAESIETLSQAAVIAELGCDKGQGNSYSKPLSPAQLVRFIQDFKELPVPCVQQPVQPPVLRHRPMHDLTWRPQLLFI